MHSELTLVMTVTRPRGVTASTLDSESSDRGSNPREAFFPATFEVSLVLESRQCRTCQDRVF